MQRILVTTDGSDGAERAVDFAAELAKAVNGSLHILHVAGDLSGEALEEVRRSPSLEKAVGDAIDAQTNRILARALERARLKGAQDVRAERSWGDVAEKILEMVQSLGADTLVVGRRGRGRLSGLLLGSVSQKVTSLAPCVVVVVP